MKTFIAALALVAANAVQAEDITTYETVAYFNVLADHTRSCMVELKFGGSLAEGDCLKLRSRIKENGQYIDFFNDNEEFTDSQIKAVNRAFAKHQEYMAEIKMFMKD